MSLRITGLGALSAHGIGIDAHQDRPAFMFDSVDDMHGAEMPDFEVLEVPSDFNIKDWVKPVGLRRKQRFSHLAMAAAIDAYRSAAFTEEQHAQLHEQIGVILSTEYGPQRVVNDYLDGLVQGGLEQASPGLFTQTVYNVANGQACLALKLKGANSTLVGSSPLAYAAHLLEDGKASALLSLSVDETNDVMGDYFRRLREDAPHRMRGFRWGEAAAAVVLETGESAEARGRAPLGDLLSESSASASHITACYSEWHDDDDTLELTMRGALERAAIGIEEIGLVVAAGNGMQGLMASELAALRSLDYAGRIVYPRLALGECFGGNEALAVVIGLAAAQPGEFILLNSTTVSGAASSFVLRKADS